MRLPSTILYLLTALLPLLFAFRAARALDVTVPADMFEWELVSVNPNETGYYYLEITSNHMPSGTVHNYLVILDSDGEIVYYRKPADSYEQHGVFLPLEEAGRIAVGFGPINLPSGFGILDQTYTFTDTIPNTHPHNPELVLDTHELRMPEDGSTWTLWHELRIVDMSLYIPGGQTNVEVLSHVIDQWDSEGNRIWTWRGFDHLDALPYTGRIDSTQLYTGDFEHLHLNSLDFFPDGDLLVSSRNLSIVFRIDYDTGDVLWRMGGGPLNDFTFSNSTGRDVPLDFNTQHDARALENGHITLFDNGTHHDPPLSYARDYSIDAVNPSADLFRVRTTDPPALSRFTGSVRLDDELNTLIGWGSRTPVVNGQEFDSEGNLLWQIDYLPDRFNHDELPASYRVLKSSLIGVAAAPYVSDYLGNGRVELYCNWFGHEDEVASFDVFCGDTDNPPFHGNTTSGVYIIEADVDPGQRFARIQALNDAGEPISGYSNTITFDIADVSVPEAGGAPRLPRRMELAPAWPNPFNSTTRFTLSLPVGGEVDLCVTNLLGQPVSILADGPVAAGEHVYTLTGSRLASGLYFVWARSGGHVAVRRITLVR